MSNKEEKTTAAPEAAGATFVGSKGGLYEDAFGLTFEYIDEEEAEFLYEEIFILESYLKHGIKLWTGATVLDLGANIGTE